MNTNLSYVTIAMLTIGFASPAFAVDDDVAACEGKAEGDACEEADGETGTCLPDGVDGVLECEDNQDDTGPDDEEGACEGKSEGDACEEADGEKGTCQVDDDSTALECEDGPDGADDADDDDGEATGDASSALGGGCSAGATGTGGGLAFASALAAMLWQRTRTARRRVS